MSIKTFCFTNNLCINKIEMMEEKGRTLSSYDQLLVNCYNGEEKKIIAILFLLFQFLLFQPL